MPHSIHCLLRFVVENTVEENVQTIYNLRRAAISNTRGDLRSLAGRNGGLITIMDLATLLQSSIDGNYRDDLTI
jgi:hypothetical protein